MDLRGRIPLQENLVSPPRVLSKGTLRKQGKINTHGSEKSTIFKKIFSHNKLSPIVFLKPAHHRGRPAQIETAKKNIRAAYFNRSLLKRINTKRKKRSDGMESLCLIGEALLHYCDLSTLQVGIPSDREFLYLPVTPPAYKQDGFSLLTEVNRGRDEEYKVGKKRVERALRALEKSNYLIAHRRYKKTVDGQFKGIASAKRLTDAFFRDLGISKAKLDRERKYRAKEIVKDQERKKQTTKAIDFIYGMNDQKPNTPVLSGREYIDARLEGAKALTDAVRAANPTWTDMQVAMFILKRKKPPP